MIVARDAWSIDPRFEQIRKLSEISRAFTYTTSLADVASLTVERGADLLDARAAVLMLLDAGDQLQVRAAHGVGEQQIARFRAPFDDETIARLHGLLDVTDDALMAVPLVVGGSVSGLIAIALRRAATEADEWLLSALADQAAVALENARLGGEVRVELEERLRASQGATNDKDRALSTLAHDIRSPLGAIEGYCTMLEDGVLGTLTDKQLDALGRIRMSGRHLLSLLENVMDMARLAAGAVCVRTDIVELREIAQDAVDLLSSAAVKKHQSLVLAAGQDIRVTADGPRLRQVLVNLIGNAVKFTPPDGAITVSARQCVVGTVAWGEIRVMDTGPGISEADRARVFDPYYRSEGTALIPGIGLGLAISRGLVKQMGGVLDVESELGTGSTFIVRLPLPDAPFFPLSDQRIEDRRHD